MIDLSRNADGSSDVRAFARDVAEGLSREQKRLPSRYFYDAAGSELFRQIMELPEYYLTRSEFELLTQHRKNITEHFTKEGFFHLIDLGAGDAFKTKILLKELSHQQHAFDYVPVDISGDAMQQLTNSLQQELPDVQVQAVVGEYAQALEWLQVHKSERKVVLFLGSNIGNFDADEGLAFLSSIRGYLDKGDQLLMGVDLRKDPDTILLAYDDSSGTTAAFNLNLLHRINRELGGNFDLEQFRHYALYDPQEGVMRSFLISQQQQQVYLRSLDRSYTFAAWEAVHTENSRKYTMNQVQGLGQQSGFRTDTIFQDERRYFADVLFTAV